MLYDHPFSRSYWQDSLRDFRRLQTLAFSALMIAACVALSYLHSIPVVNNIRVGWSFLARALCAMVGGPVNALVFGFAEDTVSYLMNPSGGYNPFYIFTTMLGVFTYSLFLYRTRVTVLRVVLAKLATNLQNVFLGGLGTYLWYANGKGYWVIVGGSAVKNAIMLPVQVLMLCLLFAAMLPALKRCGFLPHPEMGRLYLWRKRERG